jgi:hypothetical protein
MSYAIQWDNGKPEIVVLNPSEIFSVEVFGMTFCEAVQRLMEYATDTVSQSVD